MQSQCKMATNLIHLCVVSVVVGGKVEVQTGGVVRGSVCVCDLFKINLLCC